MATGDNFVSIAQKRLLGLQDFKDRFLDYVLARLKDMHDNAFGDDGVFGGVPITMSVHSGNLIQLDLDKIGTDNDGHFLITDAELAGRDVGLQFENTGSTIYDVALHYAERPRGVQVNPRTALPEWIAWEETIGERADPNAVVDNGSNITFTVDSVVNPFDATAITGAGRQVLVWKKVLGESALTEAIAVEQLTITWDGSNNKVTTSGLLGQATVSTTASDYYALLLGPTIIRNSIKALDIEPAYEFIGKVTGATPPTVFDILLQNDLGVGYAVALNAITRVDSHGDLKVRVNADASDTNERQISVENSSAVTKWSVDEDGDMDHESGATVTYKDGSAAEFQANTELRIEDNALVTIKGASGLTLSTSGGQLLVESGAEVAIESGGKLAAESGSLVEVASGSQLLLKGTERVDYDSRQLTRIAALVPHNLSQGTFDWSDADDMILEAQAVGGDVLIKMPPLPHGASLNEIRLTLKGAAGHTAGTMTATPPKLRMQYMTRTGTAAIDIATADDTTDTTTYESVHELVITGMSHTIDLVNNMYVFELENEVGGDALAGLLLYSLVVKCTLTTQSEWDV